MMKVFDLEKWKKWWVMIATVFVLTASLSGISGYAVGGNGGGGGSTSDFLVC